MVGEWRTQYGVYTVQYTAPGGLNFEEPQTQLHGVLKQEEDDWHVAEIHDRRHDDVVFGYLRLKRDGEFMRSSFTHSLSMAWSNPGLWASRLPYDAVYDFKNHKTATEDAECCCICLEDLKDNERVARLTCNHVYHRECIRHWFGMHGGCPLRCGSSQCTTWPAPSAETAASA